MFTIEPEGIHSEVANLGLSSFNSCTSLSISGSLAGSKYITKDSQVMDLGVFIRSIDRRHLSPLRTAVIHC